MLVQFNATDLARLTRATELLLSPLRYRQVDDWRREVNRELRALVGADSMGFLLPARDAAPMYSDEIPPETLAPFPELLPPALADGTPIWQRAIEMGVSTLDAAYGAEMPRYESSAYYNEFALPGGAAQTMAVCMAIGGPLAPAGAASIQCWRASAGTPRFGERETAMLRIIEPAFRAGVEARLRFGGQGDALLRTIDLLDHAVMAFGANGQVLHVTPAVERLLRDDPEGEIIRLAMVQHGRQLSVSLASGVSDPCSGARRELRTRAAAYTLNCCRSDALDAEPLLLVSLQREGVRRRSAEELRRVFRLTAQEAVVARLLAEGKRNAEVAAALGISEHTAKRHTEQVLAKLGVASRGQVSAKIDA